MKPLRRKNATNVTTDQVSGQDRVLEWTQEEDVLSDQGSVDSMAVRRTFFLDCGCEGEAAGRCFECGAISCRQCHGRGQGCQKPICLQHSRCLEMDQGQVRLCRSCFDRISRRQTRAKIGRFMLSLLVQSEGDRHE